MTTTTDVLVGLNGFVAWKPPVRVATTANITLSGEQTIDGVAVVSGDRVLVKDQTTASENGIWVAATGAWTRATDFNGARDVVYGTQVLANSGTAGGGAWFRVTTSGTITIGSTAITFEQTNDVAATQYSYATRSAANAALAAAEDDGTIVLMGGALYQVDSTATGANSCTNDLSVDGLIPFGTAGIDARCFGIEGDSSVTYDTEWGALLDYAIDNNTSPSGLSGWGEAKVLLPKGRIRLTSGFTPNQSTIGLTIEGQGKYATVIEFESDTAHLFTLTANLAFTLKDMSIIHVDQGAGFGSWTCRMITRSGVGGGQQLHLDKIHTQGFAYIDYNSGTSNNDTTRYTNCQFNDAQTVMYGRSSQAVINRIEHCSVGGLTTKAFDLGGYGTTVWDTCNIVIDGITLELADSSGLYGIGSVYTFNTCKWEAWNEASHGSGSQTQILNVVSTSQFAGGNVTFNDCVYQGGEGTLDATNYPVITTRAGVNVEWRGGAIRTDARIETIGGSTNLWDDHGRVLFDGLRAVPAPSNLIQTDTPQPVHPVVTWVNCVDVPNMSAVNERNVGGVSTRHVNILSSGTPGYLENGSTTDHVLDFGGWKQRIVEIYETSGDKIDDHNTKVYSDSGKLTQVGDNLDVTVANGYANDAEYVAPVTSVANEIVDYLKIEVANGLGSFGTIVVVTDAIPTRGT